MAAHRRRDASYEVFPRPRDEGAIPAGPRFPRTLPVGPGIGPTVFETGNRLVIVGRKRDRGFWRPPAAAFAVSEFRLDLCRSSRAGRDPDPDR
jgi:hypothetical protein